MKQKILIHMNIQRSSEYDIFNATNFNELNLLIQKKDNKQCPNFGNRLWFQGLISEIQNEENIIEYYEYSMTKDYINSNYDLIIAPMANIFSFHFKNVLEALADKFKDIRIPVYVIACGVQAQNYDELDILCNILKEPATRFIKSIYQTGGEFALRGYFSKEFFDKLGFKTAVVTGCPSLYQLGEDFTITKKDIEADELKVIFNGRLRDYSKMVKKYFAADFFDQHVFYHQLYDEKYFQDTDLRSMLKTIIKQEGMKTAEWLCQGKIKLIPDMNVWREYIKQQNYNFSFGKRIHGNIMSILAGIPAVVDACDSRVREMAEFFDIPYILPGEIKNYKSIYELYNKCDYKAFNRGFKNKYKAYEKFLVERGIVKKINSDNQFFYDLDEIVLNVVNQKNLADLEKTMKENYFYYKCLEAILEIVRKIRG